MKKEDIYYDEIPSSIATFKSSLDKPVHRWFRLTPSYGAELVNLVLDEIGHKDGEVVLDPYSGASTTLIECKKKGIKSFGFEINPLLHFIGEARLGLDSDTVSLKSDLSKVKKLFKKIQKKYFSISIEESDLEIPPIHNPHRWWREDVLKDLLCLKRAIYEADISLTSKNIFKVALAGVLVPDLSNVTLGKLQLHFIDRSSDEIDVESIFFNHAQSVVEDVSLLESSYFSTESNLFLTDALNPETKGSLIKADTVITSPPYVNRYSYVWNTRPHLFFLDIFTTPKESSQLDLKTVGGTWGTATSILNKGVVTPEYDTVNKHVFEVSEKIRKESNLMANYVVKYFNALANQIQSMDLYLNDDAKVAYVIGLSKISGIRVEADLILAKMFEDFGYKKVKVRRFRKRNSGKDLFESIVYGWK
jgi:hypothetical protein